MNTSLFARVAASLRQYRRAHLGDFAADIGEDPIDATYVDPLPDQAVLQLMLSGNTTFILGRKGTGKSTIFAKAQSEIRRQNQSLSIYLDVKSLYDLLASDEAVVTDAQGSTVHPAILQAHKLRKSFLGAVLADLLKELDSSFDRLSLYDRWVGKRREYADVKRSIERLRIEVRKGTLSREELPILQSISIKAKERAQETDRRTHDSSVGGKLAPHSVSANAQLKESTFEETLSDREMYQAYSDAVLRSFPFADIISQIRDLLEEIGMKRLVVFFDDFSELALLNQRLFVDVILAPLNNASGENIKLKVAAYPGRVYYGTIDPGKIDTVNLDFDVLYKNQDLQTTESAAIDYTTRLVEQRFAAFGGDINDYLDPSFARSDFMRLMFETTFNVPRLMGYILHYCYLDRVSHGNPITAPAVRLAAQKYYEQILLQYFERMNRFALEPFERKLDRRNQFDLLRMIIAEAKQVRRKIVSGDVGGDYFKGLKNPPVSHFAVSPSLEKVLAGLEMNFLISKYHTLRDKDRKEVVIYALHYGLTESERLGWGYPRERRLDRNYFIQRTFNFNTAIHHFLGQRQTIRCPQCHTSFGLEEQKSLERYGWLCPECRDGICEIVSLSDDIQAEMAALDRATMLKPMDLEILGTLHEEGREMRAGEIAKLIDTDYRLVGHRTSRLRDSDLVRKAEVGGHMRNSLTTKAHQVYFGEEADPREDSSSVDGESSDSR
jgi:DNA-binding transcriptional ArsR family regulator